MANSKQPRAAQEAASPETGAQSEPAPAIDDLDDDLEPPQAYHLAAACACAAYACCGGAGDATTWAHVDPERPATKQDVAALADMAAFRRANAEAPAEALWRHAQAMGHHAQPADGWRDAGFATRAAYWMFCAALPIADRLIAERDIAWQSAPAPAAPRATPEQETALARFDGVGARIDDPPRMVTL